MRERLPSSGLRAGLAVLKLIVVPITVCWILLNVLPKGQTINVSLHPQWLVAAVVTSQVALWLVSLRLVQLLAIYAAPLRTRSALRINLRSMFYFLVLPTPAGMEAVRFLGAVFLRHGL